MITFAFGIVHGFGFSFAVRDELQFAGDHLVASLLAFNLGVEIGQVLLLLVFVPALALFFRYVPERIGTICAASSCRRSAFRPSDNVNVSAAALTKRLRL
jgi:uncharacterized membrane-anchored protein YitT (DUF2179 family)